MGERTGIEWTNHTWNPWRGCIKVSAGCKNCYMYRDQVRYGRDPRDVMRAAPATFNAPLKWHDPAFVFTCSWSDWFIEEADVWRDDAWSIVRQTPHLTYQILTKRPENMAARLPADWGEGWPNVWLGVSAEDQATADLRLPILAATPAAVRFLSAEPLLGPIDLSTWFGYAVIGQSQWDAVEREGLGDAIQDIVRAAVRHMGGPPIHWVIGGGESGPSFRRADLAWFRSLRDQCQRAGVPYFHKQHGGNARIAGHWGGRELDGRTWDEMPARASEAAA